MSGLEQVGKVLIILGVVITLAGGGIWLLGKAFPSLKDLPGTLRWEGAGFTCIVPILASILLSILLTILLNIISRVIQR
ncbi:MAG TPA: DUF2905 family protein [Anaerolineaceae bacterium]